MTDAVADKSELENSGASLNYHSWLQGEAEDRATSPLLHKEKGQGLRRSTPEHASIRGGTQSSASGSGSKSAGTLYKQLLDSQESQQPFVTKTLFGEVRNCRRLSWVEWLFVVIATVSMAGTLGISVERFVFLQRTFGNMTPDSNYSYMVEVSDGVDESVDVVAGINMDYCGSWTCLNDFIFAVLILVNLAFSVYYCYDGLLRERPFEVIGFAVTVLILTAYVIVNYFMEGEQDDVFKLVRLVLVCLLGPQNIVLALVVQYRMGFLVLHTIGTNKQLIRAHRIRSLFLTMQTFNIQVLANVLVLTWARAGRFTSLGEKVLLPVLFVYMIVTSYLGWVAVMWEKRKMALAWNLLVVISFGYYIFKIVNVSVHWSYYREVFTDYYVKGEPTAHTHFLYVAIVLLLACGLGLLSCIVMTLLMLSTLLYFDIGLKERLPPPCCVTSNYIPGVSEL